MARNFDLVPSKFNPGCCCKKKGCPSDCLPCAIPQRTITMSWTTPLTSLSPNSGSISLEYDGTSVWLGSKKFTYAGYQFGEGGGDVDVTYQFSVRCTIRQIELRATITEISGGFTGYPVGSVFTTLTNTGIWGDLRCRGCSPFWMQWIRAINWSIGISQFDFKDETGEPPANCCVASFKLFGCDARPLPLAGQTVEVLDSCGGSLGSGTTNSRGVASIDVLMASSYTVTTTVARFESYRRLATIACAAQSSIFLNSDDQHSCLTGCASPPSNTLYATFTLAGPQTLVKSGVGWQASFTVADHDYEVTIYPDGTTRVIRDGASCGDATFAVASCPDSPMFSASLTPAPGDCLDELGTAVITE